MRILIVDDSGVTRLLLRSVFEAEGYQVREASSGAQALKILEDYTPDIVTMDVHMPDMDGYETTARILEKHALPVVVITASADPYATATAMRALEAGALAVLEKPSGPAAADFSQRMHEVLQVLQVLRNMAQVKIVRRPRKLEGASGKQHSVPQLINNTVNNTVNNTPQLVAIAASAGGPVALKTLLQTLLLPQPWALILVQHIANGFLLSFRDWLASLSALPVAVAEEGQILTPGVLYLAPDGVHLGFSAERRVRLHTGPPEEHLRPSANYLFRSVAQQFGKQAIGIQLSGMGRDGAQGLAELYKTGALTLVQEPSSAVIDSMPRAAIDLQAARQVLPPEDIGLLLNLIATQLVPPNSLGKRE
ncbi:MAG: chemotaxis protein CheB [Pseudomonas sp.]|uniref:chemotaxis protein CheB n=1 Tax=Pseudomonas sp. TaxID=306 RepID=UPI0027350AE3|nr:chemotaxis protein CheB [Pseudomonas sp.]MDP3848327.1 chemotaxis protein CheB [Pseudomonas sp.]